MRRAVRALLVCVPVVLASPHRAGADEPTLADKAAAERLYNEGKTLIQRKDYEGACQKFAESLRLENGIGVMLRLADCSEKLGKTATAWALFREAAALADKQGDDRGVIARKHADTLEPTLSTMTVVVPPASDVAGLEVKRDGTVVGRAQWGTGIPVDIGAHVIVASAPSRAPWQTTEHVAGDQARVSVTVPVLLEGSATQGSSSASASRDGPPSVLPGAGLHGRAIAGIAVAGAGVIALGLGTYFGFHAKSLYDDSNANGCRADSHCTPAGGQMRNDARAAAMAANVSIGLGLAAVAGGAVLFFTAPKAGAPKVGLYAQPLEGGVFFSGRTTF